jgi:hypothetical protein
MFKGIEVGHGISFLRAALELVCDLVTWPKKALLRHFFIFFQLRSSAMRLQKGKKLTKNSSFLTQAPNRKQALIGL